MKFKQASVPRQPGEKARMKVVRGADFGSVFVITGGRAVIGRGEDCDIMISDLKASRQHLEVLLAQNGWYVRDLGSANGILINGKVTREGYIQARDAVSVGETVLEFMGGDQPTMMLVAPARTPAEIENEAKALAEQKKRVQQVGRIGGAPGAGNKKPAQGDSKRTLLMLVGVGVFAYMLFSGEQTAPPQKKSNKAQAPKQNLEQYLPQTDAPSVSKAAEMFFKNGFREYSQGNYLRAKAQFETVLQMAPNHPLATLYMTNCENKIKEEVKAHLDTGRKSFEAGRLKEAKGHFEAVLRLLFKDQLNPAYIEARDQLKKTLAEIRGEADTDGKMQVREVEASQ